MLSNRFNCAYLRVWVPIGPICGLLIGCNLNDNAGRATQAPPLAPARQLDVHSPAPPLEVSGLPATRKGGARHIPAALRFRSESELERVIPDAQTLMEAVYYGVRVGSYWGDRAHELLAKAPAGPDGVRRRRPAGTSFVSYCIIEDPSGSANPVYVRFSDIEDPDSTLMKEAKELAVRKWTERGYNVHGKGYVLDVIKSTSVTVEKDDGSTEVIQLEPVKGSRYLLNEKYTGNKHSSFGVIATKVSGPRWMSAKDLQRCADAISSQASRYALEYSVANWDIQSVVRNNYPEADNGSVWLVQNGGEYRPTLINKTTAADIDADVVVAAHALDGYLDWKEYPLKRGDQGGGTDAQVDVADDGARDAQSLAYVGLVQYPLPSDGTPAYYLVADTQSASPDAAKLCGAYNAIAASEVIRTEPLVNESIQASFYALIGIKTASTGKDYEAAAQAAQAAADVLSASFNPHYDPSDWTSATCNCSSYGGPNPLTFYYRID